MALEDEVRVNFALADLELRSLSTPVNDVFVVETPTDRFALKLYHAKRTMEQVRWEVELLLHLRRRHAPVVVPVEGHHGFVEVLRVEGAPRLAVLCGWAPGEKPAPAPDVYALLGDAAARIHQAADSFGSARGRDGYDAHALIDDQLERMKKHLWEAGRWAQAHSLGIRLNEFLVGADLDRGICHMDLTLDNVHVDGNGLTVFDFDSAGLCWRALEPHGVLTYSSSMFQEWLNGYRSVRAFDQANADAVRAFAIIADLRVVAWQLGVAASSRGDPLLSSSDLTAIVDRWLEWEATYL